MFKVEKKGALYMMIGLPACGKSTFYKTHFDRMFKYSTDSIIDEMALIFNVTYDFLWADSIKVATKIADNYLRKTIENNDTVIWDQTNLSRKSRIGKIHRFPRHYKIVGLHFQTPDDKEWYRRLNGRPGKTIPQEVLDKMVYNSQEPELDEGFDELYTIDGIGEIIDKIAKDK